MNSNFLAIIVIAVFFIAGAFLSFNSVSTNTPYSNLDDFAKCLTEKGAVMYGAKWCTHCMNEKSAFGDSFQYATYVECPDNIKLCESKGITGFPSWILSDGKMLEGEQGLVKLSEASGCPLIENKK